MYVLVLTLEMQNWLLKKKAVVKSHLKVQISVFSSLRSLIIAARSTRCESLTPLEYLLEKQLLQNHFINCRRCLSVYNWPLVFPEPKNFTSDTIMAGYGMYCMEYRLSCCLRKSIVDFKPFSIYVDFWNLTKRAYKSFSTCTPWFLVALAFRILFWRYHLYPCGMATVPFTLPFWHWDKSNSVGIHWDMVFLRYWKSLVL